MSSDIEVGKAVVGSPSRTRSREVRAGLPKIDGELGDRRWEWWLCVATVVSDLVAITAVVLIGYWFGLGAVVPQLGDISPGVGVLGGLLTVVGLIVTRSWEPRVLGHGSDEFGRLIRAIMIGAVSLGMVGLALEATAARPWVFGLLPLSGLLAVLGRLTLRSLLHRRRRNGKCSHPVLVVGQPAAVLEMIDRTRRDAGRGWTVAGACTPTGLAPDGSDRLGGVPVLGDLDAVADVVRRNGIRVVAVCPAPGWTSRRLHQLAWNLEDGNAELVVDPGLMEVAGPRLHVSPVDGLPLLRLTRPTFSGVPWIAKHVVDRLGAILLIAVLLPVLVALAIGVALDGGPVFFRQTRVGRHGREFRMLKFRSMVVDAEARLAELTNEGAGPLFKVKDDPRVTKFGAFLRRHSLDEVPQLFNVLAGSMSLVGPRPPLPNEVAAYTREAERRLLVRPGLTGLWQVSGRSDLSWEQSVRLDLRYVENWNLALDALILWKTIGAVVSSRGAY